MTEPVRTGGPTVPGRSTLLADRPQAPLPTGLLSGRRRGWRRSIARLAAWMNRGLDMLPPGRWMHRWIRRGMHWSELELPLQRGAAGLDGLKVAFLSDLHAGSYLSAGDLDRLFGQLAEREPELVCLGGDLVNTRRSEIRLYARALDRIAPRLGIWAVPGNHDYFHGHDLGYWRDFLEERGVRVLVNEGRRIERGGAGLWIAGVDDLTEGSPDLAAALAGARDDEPVLLLAHHPDFFFEAAAVRVELVLSGHTHGGQVRFGSFIPLHHSRFGWIEGLHELEGSRLYVGRGVGVTLLPLRLGAPAEVPLLTLRVGP